jgi:hypothetical protein
MMPSPDRFPDVPALQAACADFDGPDGSGRKDGPYLLEVGEEAAARDAGDLDADTPLGFGQTAPRYGIPGDGLFSANFANPHDALQEAFIIINPHKKANTNHVLLQPVFFRPLRVF